MKNSEIYMHLIVTVFLFFMSSSEAGIAEQKDAIHAKKMYENNISDIEFCKNDYDTMSIGNAYYCSGINRGAEINQCTHNADIWNAYARKNDLQEVRKSKCLSYKIEMEKKNASN